MSYEDNFLFLEQMNPEQIKAHAKACHAISNRASDYDGEGQVFYESDECVNLYAEEFKEYFREQQRSKSRALIENKERQRLMVEGYYCIIAHNTEDVFELIGPVKHMQNASYHAAQWCKKYRLDGKGSFTVIGKAIQGHDNAFQELGKIKTQRKFQNVA